MRPRGVVNKAQTMPLIDPSWRVRGPHTWSPTLKISVTIAILCFRVKTGGKALWVQISASYIAIWPCTS